MAWGAFRQKVCGNGVQSECTSGLAELRMARALECRCTARRRARGAPCLVTLCADAEGRQLRKGVHHEAQARDIDVGLEGAEEAEAPY